MREPGFRILYLSTFVLLLATVFTSVRGLLILSGISGLATVFIYLRTSRKANRQGMNRERKVVVPLLKNTVFLTLVATAVSIPTVPKYLSITVLSAFALLLLTRSSLKERLNHTYELIFGPVEIGLAASLTILLAGINSYFGFYGSALLLILSLYQELALLSEPLNFTSRNR